MHRDAPMMMDSSQKKKGRQLVWSGSVAELAFEFVLFPQKPQAYFVSHKKGQVYPSSLLRRQIFSLYTRVPFPFVSTP
jgi:hypothetical protein